MANNEKYSVHYPWSGKEESNIILEFETNDRYGEKYVFQNPYVLGRKGETFVEAGYVWAPYIRTFDAIDIVEDPEVERQLEEKFAPKKYLRERYSQKIINEEFYRQVNIMAERYYTGNTFVKLWL